MPFTLAHPAGAVPLKRLLGKYGSLVGLVMGSIAPDIIYFLPIPATLKGYGHTLIGLFIVCIPAGLISYYLFYLLLTPIIYDLSPEILRKRLPGNWAEGIIPKTTLLPIIISILIGSITHIVWDSFTHDYGFFAQRFDILNHTIFSWEGYTLYVYKLLQHGSSLAGLGFLLWLVIRFISSTPPKPVYKSIPAWHQVILLVLTFGLPICISTITGMNIRSLEKGILFQFQQVIGHIIKTGGMVLLFWFIPFGIIYRTSKHRMNNHSAT